MSAEVACYWEWPPRRSLGAVSCYQQGGRRGAPVHRDRAVTPNVQSRSWSEESGSTWWWQQGDAVHQTHLQGQRASYYSLSSWRPFTREAPPILHTAGPHASIYSSHKQLHRGEGSPAAGLVPQALGVVMPRSVSAPARPRQSRGEPVTQAAPTIAVQMPGEAPRGRGSYRYVSAVTLPEHVPPPESLPPLSCDGGNEEEFQLYWEAFHQPMRLPGGWIERLAHPQVNIEPFWFHAGTCSTVWHKPLHSAADSDVHLAPEDASELSGSGPVWEMSVRELKEALALGKAPEIGLEPEELARRACAEFERFLPRVLSWHDYQYITFWFFGGLQKQELQGGDRRDRDFSKSFFSAEGSASRDMFADDAFFRAASKLLKSRMHKQHPINLTYFIWTYSRAGIVDPELMQAVGNHMCCGWAPTLDRCSLGTMTWNFAKLGLRHDKMFEAFAAELTRPNRLRSLAPRNYQNTLIAYSRNRHWHGPLVDAMARGIPRLLDNHDPRYPKLSRQVLFSYTCRDGSEVPADAFRIGGLTVIVKAFHELGACGVSVEKCLSSILDYTERCVERSPPMMREAGDACGLLRQLGFWLSELDPSDDAGILRGRLSRIDMQRLAVGAPEKVLAQATAALRRCGF